MPLAPAAQIGHPSQGRVALAVNGTLRQEGDLNRMIRKVPAMIAYLSDWFELAAGDITVSGVGAVARGDIVEHGIEGVDGLTVKVV